MNNHATPLRDITKQLLSRVAPADIVIGIPCFNNGGTIGKVVSTAASGLSEFFPDRPACIVIADGGSTMDDTRENALAAVKASGAHGVVGIYRGLPGKGSAVRWIFAAAAEVQAKAVVLLDSDLRSITPLWIERLLGPVLQGGYEFVAPLYVRYKYDGTITNNVAYNMTRCLYGQRIRQPIGGDFALSADLAARLAEESVWDTDIARFGIDIWLTCTALVRGARVCQARLGVKIHDAKDPAASLEPMFRQVVKTLFTCMEQTESAWMKVTRSEPTDIWGDPSSDEPEAFAVNYEALMENFFLSWRTLKGAWESILSPDTFLELKSRVASGPSAFHLTTDLWAKLLFEFAAAFHCRTTMRQQVVEVLSPLYFARVASFINRTRNCSNAEAEAVVEEQAQVFELRKPYLVDLWKTCDGLGPTCTKLR
ncbi:MAG: glycosyltransferase [Acidobacteria bacterium]|nr:MAG: glycosyltransferase [Acidobacteriota bacterium]